MNQHLGAVRAMTETPAEAKTAARQRCERVKRRSERGHPSSPRSTGVPA